MAGSLSNSLSLVKASAEVLRLDKELLVFPLLSGIATVLVMVSFVAPLALTGGWRVFDASGGGMQYAGWALAFLFYLVQYTVIFYFNSALVGAALIRMAGGDPTVSDGLRIAGARFTTILGYAAIAATVGMVLRAIAERSGVLGRVVIGFLGIGWTMASYLAVPVLVTEDVGPIDAVKESARLFKATWGEQVVGNFGLGWAVTLAALSWTAVSAGLIWASAMVTPGLALAAVALSVSGYVLLALFSSALKGVYTAALYRYAALGEAGTFDASIVRSAFRPK